MNIEILYISASITVLLITSMIVTVFWLGLRGRKFVVCLICGSFIFLLNQLLPIPDKVERNLSLLVLNVSKSGINKAELNNKISSICEDNLICGYEYFELTDRLTDAIDLAVYVNGEFEYQVYKEYTQVCD